MLVCTIVTSVKYLFPETSLAPSGIPRNTLVCRTGLWSSQSGNTLAVRHVTANVSIKKYGVEGDERARTRLHSKG